ncbi:hypothetical protein J2Z69_001898 [Paenibacillus shirakamiensis]|uniref:Tyrosine protein kinase n=1 Tax=Paenibacillus shirakamiensis TaxID=1265935 RepID=A0ABS4JGM7_9BACL|nr:hypothetical protein [Paenibacillus shirakamiensis]MBP2000867.1 hypothetical protein [Paenibacillus shirakamiensis]
MQQYYSPQRSVIPPGYPYGAPYPGLGASTSSLVPLAPAAVAPVAAEATSLVAPAAAAAKTGFSLPNIGALKGIIDGMGGIDGVLNTMGKVQQMMQGVQQFAPMAKLVMGGLLPGGKGKTNASKNQELDEYRPRRRKSRSKSGVGTKKRKSTSGKRPASRRPASKKRRR